jgi:hypothetical protein
MVLIMARAILGIFIVIIERKTFYFLFAIFSLKVPVAGFEPMTLGLLTEG